MAWPPPTLPINRTNATPQLDTHAADHNAHALAINDVVNRLTGIYVQSIKGPITTDAGGNANVSFGGSFPGIPVVVACIADPAVSGMVNVYATSATGFSIHVNATNGATFVGAVTIAYNAVYGQMR